MKKGIALLLVCILFVGFLYLLTRTPQSNREWNENFAYTQTAEVEEDGGVRMKHLRDFTYRVGSVEKETWLDEHVINPKEIVRAWFLLEPFAGFEPVGHTFLSFEMQDGSAYSFSVEARTEKGEAYSSFTGLFRQYELAYMWGTERDFVTRRLLYLEHPVYMYPLEITEAEAQALFTGLVQETNALAEKPRFYNTLTANCTNMLAKMVNEIRPQSVPYDISWNLPGFSDAFLYKIGLIKNTSPLETLKAQYDLTQHKAALNDIADVSPVEFGTQLRALLPQ